MKSEVHVFFTQGCLLYTYYILAVMIAITSVRLEILANDLFATIKGMSEAPKHMLHGSLSIANRMAVDQKVLPENDI